MRHIDLPATAATSGNVLPLPPSSVRDIVALMEDHPSDSDNNEPSEDVHSSSSSSLRDLVALIECKRGDSENDGIEPELCVRAGGILAPRLEAVRTVPVLPSGDSCSLAGQVSPRGTYLITGGTGGIGLDLALRFARAGAGGLVLLSRRGEGFVAGLQADSPSARAWEALSGIPSTKVIVLRCDVTIKDDVSSAFAAAGSAEAGLPPVRGIVHAACPSQWGNYEGGKNKLDHKYLEAKISGALHLSEAAARMGLKMDFLVFLSSASAVLGLAGGAAYAAANGCLDGLAWHLRKSLGWKVLSMQYGPWVQAGMVVDRKGGIAAIRARGYLGVTNDEGFSALGALIGELSSKPADVLRSPPVVAVMPIEWQRYASQLPGVPPPLISSLVNVTPPMASHHGRHLSRAALAVEDVLRIVEAVSWRSIVPYGWATTELTLKMS